MTEPRDTKHPAFTPTDQPSTPDIDEVIRSLSETLNASEKELKSKTEEKIANKSTTNAKSAFSDAVSNIFGRGNSSSHSLDIQPAPPLIGEMLVRLISPKNMRDAILGDCEELFNKNIKFGLRRAQWIYWCEVLTSTSPLLFTKLKRWGVIALVLDAIRRVVGG